MDQHISNLYTLVYWMAGVFIITVGTMIGWMWTMNTDLQKKVTYTWIEEIFSKDIKKDIEELTEVVKEIRDVFAGDLHGSGLIGKIQNMDSRISKLEDKK